MNTKGFDRNVVATSPPQAGGFLGTSPSAAFSVSPVARLRFCVAFPHKKRSWA